MLNSSQQRAIQMTEGPCLIIAGAGTGKTKTIIEKLAFLIKNGAQPERILALTFSNEAADQLKNRAIELAPESRLAHISTFHSFCADFIRGHPRECSVPESFTIMEELDAAIMLKRQLNLETGTALRYANTISKAKDLGLALGDYKNYLETQENLLAEFFNKKNWDIEYQRSLVRLRTLHLDTIKSREEREKLIDYVATYENYTTYMNFAEAWIKYETLKRERKSLDYADLNKIVLDYAETYGHGALSAAFDYIIVDEFQDTNKVQFELLKHLTAAKRNITVVGDQNQTVYAFRGAYANNIEKFRQVFNLAENQVVRLETNYRSTDRILRSAHSLIRNNYNAPDECVMLKSFDMTEGEKVRVLKTVDPKEQARRIIEEIELLVKDGTAYRDIAILYRSHNSASMIKRALTQRGIPYSITGGTEFFFQPEVKTVVSYLYILNNFSNPLLQADQAWWKIMHGRYGLSAADSTLLAEFKKKKKASLQAVIYHHLEQTGMSKDGKERIRKMTAAIDQLRSKRNRRLSELIVEIYGASGIAREYDADREAMGNLRRLHTLAETFETFHGDDLASFVAYVELVDEIGGLSAERMEQDESVKLMTIHAAKGLEFPAVFVIDMVRDKFPLTRGGAEPFIPIELNEQYEPVLAENYKDDREKEKAIREFTSNIKLKEERRLAYVALTRAKRRLFLTLARDYGGEPREPSPFLIEIGAQAEWFAKDSGEAADIALTIDNDLKAKEGGDSELDRAAAFQKKLMMAAMERRDMQASQYHMMIYHSLLEGKPVGKGPAAREAERILTNIANNNATGIKFNPSAIAFSVTSLGTYIECPKKYELKEILRMPSRDDEDNTVLGFGSAIHEILEKAAAFKIGSKEELDSILAEKTKSDPEFDLERARRILDVFWQRNKANIASTVATEKYFRFSMSGFVFSGKIDRIDSLGDGRVRIVDYKTGYVNYDVTKDDRERQLIMYALALANAPEFAANKWKPAELTLEMLEKEKPLEFTLDGNIMSPKEGRIKPVSVDEIKQQIIDTAKNIANDYEKGFKAAETDAPCRFCSYKLYCPKFD